MKELFGDSISYIYINDDKTIMVFLDLFGKLYAYHTYSDCCSDTWFDEIINPENLIREQVIGIEIMETKDIPVIRENHERHHECIENYGYKLKTCKGYTEIIYRNDSNGYYGGGCEYLPNAQLELKHEDTIRQHLLNKQPLNIRLDKNDKDWYEIKPFKK